MAMMNYTDEEFHQYTMEETFQKEVKPNLFAISRIFAEAHKQMNLSEYKTLTLELSRLNWKDKCPDTMYVEKKELASIIGINSDPDHLSQDLKRAIGEMPRHSFLEFDEQDKDIYVSGNFVRTVAMFKNVVRLRLEEEFLGLFGNLEGGKERISQYITMWSEDIFQMKSQRAILFYELLRDHSDTRLVQNTGTVSIKKFKEMYGIPKCGKGSYMTTNGHFARTHFERYVIDPLCDELSKTHMIQLIVQPNGKYYEKVKTNNRVIAYRFWWTITSMPGVVSAVTDKTIQEKQIKNPQTMKIAQDILKGKKKKKEQKKSLTHGDADYNAMVEELMKQDKKKEGE